MMKPVSIKEETVTETCITVECPRCHTFTKAYYPQDGSRPNTIMCKALGCENILET